MKRIEQDSHRLKIGGDGGWFFSVPLTFIMTGVIMFAIDFFLMGKSIRDVDWIVPSVFIAAGVVLYAVQYRKLEFRELCMPPDLEKFKVLVREIMREGEWIIVEDNEYCIRATDERDDIFQFYTNMVTLQFWGRTIRYNIINDPDTYRSGFASMLSPCTGGKRLINEIRNRMTTAQ